jgi:hypothetical protein
VLENLDRIARHLRRQRLQVRQQRRRRFLRFQMTQLNSINQSIFQRLQQRDSVRNNDQTTLLSKHNTTHPLRTRSRFQCNRFQ